MISRAVVLADSRYNRQDKRSKFPPWITQFLGESALNLSVDVAVAQVGFTPSPLQFIEYFMCYQTKTSSIGVIWGYPLSAIKDTDADCLTSERLTSPLSSISLQIKTFLKEMGQPVDSAAFRAIVFDEEEVGHIRNCADCEGCILLLFFFAI